MRKHLLGPYFFVFLFSFFGLAEKIEVAIPSLLGLQSVTMKKDMWWKFHSTNSLTRVLISIIKTTSNLLSVLRRNAILCELCQELVGTQQLHQSLKLNGPHKACFCFLNIKKKLQHPFFPRRKGLLTCKIYQPIWYNQKIMSSSPSSLPFISYKRVAASISNYKPPKKEPTHL